ncbi:MAG: hypothetical protein V3575_00460 [Candidatus Absconditabacteria bacterium]
MINSTFGKKSDYYGKSKGILNGIKKGLIDILGSEDEKYFVRQLGIDSDDYRLLKLILKMLNNRNYKGLGPKESNNYTWKDLREYVRIKDGKIESLGDLLPYTMPIDISKEDKGFQERMLGRTIISENEEEKFIFKVYLDDDEFSERPGLKLDLRGANIEKQLAFIKKLEAGDYSFYNLIGLGCKKGNKLEGIEKILNLKSIKVKQLDKDKKGDEDDCVIVQVALDMSNTDISNLGNLEITPSLILNNMPNFKGFDGVKVVEGRIELKNSNIESQIDLVRRIFEKTIDVYGEVVIIPNQPGLERALENLDIKDHFVYLNLDLRGMPLETQQPWDDLSMSGKVTFVKGYYSDNIKAIQTPMYDI